MRAAWLALVVVLMTTGTAVADNAPLTAQQRQHRFACVCDMCKRRPLDVCQCKQADSMRTQLGLVVARPTVDEREIDRQMAEKYGASVLSPLSEPDPTREVPWLGPFVIGVLGAGIVWRIARTIRRRRGR